MKESFQAQMYSLKAFPQELRTHFVLPGDPYLPEFKDAAAEYLRNLGVVYYRDEAHGCTGIIIETAARSPFVEDLRTFAAYKTMGIFNYVGEKITVSRWPAPTEKHVAVHGDDKSWLVWNKEVTIYRISSEQVVQATTT